MNLRIFNRKKKKLLRIQKNYLIDPDIPGTIVNVAAHTILVASPNRQHYYEYSTPIFYESMDKSRFISINKLYLS